MERIRAVTVDPSARGRLALRDVAPPVPLPSEALVKVAAISLNRGEVRRSQAAEAGWRPGWDFAGTVVQADADGAGPPIGTRVVGMLNPGAWAEIVAAPTYALAPIPPQVSFAQAATLPVAGLTALYCLERGSGLLGRTVLVTGASGGVGHLACQLARLGGARVVGVVRQRQHAALVESAKADHVVVSDDAEAAREFGPFSLILESVGGRVLGNVMTMLAPDGTCVTFGASSGAETTFNVSQFYLTGGARLYGFIIFHEVRRYPAGAGLARLLRLVATGQLRPHIEIEAPWSEIGEIARGLLDRRYPGKAVLHVAE